MMTQYFLFLLMIVIGAAYARKYGNKAKADIERFQKNKKEEEEDQRKSN
ncbi:hypothetical protein [Flavobacterium sp.]